jgi:hypothetical protein
MGTSMAEVGNWYHRATSPALLGKLRVRPAVQRGSHEGEQEEHEAPCYRETGDGCHDPFLCNRHGGLEFLVGGPHQINVTVSEHCCHPPERPRLDHMLAVLLQPN